MDDRPDYDEEEEFDDDNDDDDDDETDDPRGSAMKQLVGPKVGRHFTRVVVPKKHLVNVFVHSIVDGLIHFYAFIFLLFVDGGVEGDAVDAGGIAYFVFGW